MKQKVNKVLVFVTVFIAWTWLVFMSGRLIEAMDVAFDEVGSATYKLEELIVVSRSPDWKYGKGFYVAVVSAIQNDNSTYDVGCKVHVGNANYFEYIPLGQVASLAEVMDRWGMIVWTDNALIIGTDGPYQKIVAKKEIETHR
jgi:hypothetical protein